MTPPLGWHRKQNCWNLFVSPPKSSSLMLRRTHKNFTVLAYFLQSDLGATFLVKIRLKIHRIWPLFWSVICLGHNFLQKKEFYIPFSLVIYTFATLSDDTNIGHFDLHIIYIMAVWMTTLMAIIEKRPLWLSSIWPFYENQYGKYWYHLKELQKCVSWEKTVCKTPFSVKSYGQNKSRTKIMAISCVFWAYF